MLSSTAHAISEVMIEYEGRPEPVAADRDLYGFSALYRLYEAADGEWLFLAAPSAREWDRLTQAVPALGLLAADPRFAAPRERQANDGALSLALGELFRTRPAADWERDLLAADVACVVCAQGPVEANYLDEGSVGRLQDYVTDGHHPILDDVPRLRPLVAFSRSGVVAGNAGLVGQDTQRVLRDYGYNDLEIGRLAEEGVVLLN
jgi:crotonobetainyl-CoA:carnitine CoA-transferase CaiB-like acyl-CoA transferase